MPLIVLVDDDPLVRMTWKTAAERAKRKFRAFASPAAFDAGEIPQDAEVYVDWQIAKGETAEAFVKDLSARGYANISIATGREPGELPKLEFVRAVIGKEPLW